MVTDTANITITIKYSVACQLSISISRVDLDRFWRYTWPLERYLALFLPASSFSCQLCPFIIVIFVFIDLSRLNCRKTFLGSKLQIAEWTKIPIRTRNWSFFIKLIITFCAYVVTLWPFRVKCKTKITFIQQNQESYHFIPYLFYFYLSTHCPFTPFKAKYWTRLVSQAKISISYENRLSNRYLGWLTRICVWRWMNIYIYIYIYIVYIYIYI